MSIYQAFPESSVSIVIPTYNCVDMLREALESIYTQTLPQQQIQIIVIDDGSADGTWEFLLKEQQSRTNLIALHQENSGHPSVGRNRGILRATNDFIFFLDSDDWFGPESLERLLHAAETNDAEMVLGKQVGQNRTVNKTAFSKTLADADIVDDNLWQVLSPCRLISRSLIMRLGISFPEDMAQGEDQVFISQCYFGANRISVLADYDYYFVRGREDGTNLSRRIQTLENKRLTVTRMSRIILANTVPGERRQELFHRVIFRTLAPALGKPFRNASNVERQTLLDELGEVTFPSMREQDLATASDISRLRLTTARLGEAADVLELDGLLAKDNCQRVQDGRIIYDLGEHLNSVLSVEERRVTNSLPFKPTFNAIEFSSDQCQLKINVGAPLIKGLELDMMLEAHLRDGSTMQAFQSDIRQTDEQLIAFTIPLSTLFKTRGSKSTYWDMRVVIFDEGSKLTSEKIRNAPEAAPAEKSWTSNCVNDRAENWQFRLYTTKGGFISIRAISKSSVTPIKSMELDKSTSPKSTNQSKSNIFLHRLNSIKSYFKKQ